MPCHTQSYLNIFINYSLSVNLNHLGSRFALTLKFLTILLKTDNLVMLFLYYIQHILMKTLKQIIDTKDIKKLLTISPTQTVIEALIVMAEYKIGALLVTDKSKMVGIISERDYAREIILHKKSSKETLVRDIMTKKVLSLQPSDSFEKGLEVMSEKKIRHIPVLKGNEIVGMVSQGDLVK